MPSVATNKRKEKKNPYTNIAIQQKYQDIDSSDIDNTLSLAVGVMIVMKRRLIVGCEKNEVSNFYQWNNLTTNETHKSNYNTN